jgi:hypothetical protein
MWLPMTERHHAASASIDVVTALRSAAMSVVTASKIGSTSVVIVLMIASIDVVTASMTVTTARRIERMHQVTTAQPIDSIVAATVLTGTSIVVAIASIEILIVAATISIGVWIVPAGVPTEPSTVVPARLHAEVISPSRPVQSGLAAHAKTGCLSPCARSSLFCGRRKSAAVDVY